MISDNFRSANSWTLKERKAVDAAWYAMIEIASRGMGDSGKIRTWLISETEQRGAVLARAMIVCEFRDGMLNPDRTIANVATLSAGLLLARVAGAGHCDKLQTEKGKSFCALVDTSESARAAWNLRWRKSAGLES